MIQLIKIRNLKEKKIKLSLTPHALSVPLKSSNLFISSLKAAPIPNKIFMIDMSHPLTEARTSPDMKSGHFQTNDHRLWKEEKRVGVPHTMGHRRGRCGEIWNGRVV